MVMIIDVTETSVYGSGDSIIVKVIGEGNEKVYLDLSPELLDNLQQQISVELNREEFVMNDQSWEP